VIKSLAFREYFTSDYEGCVRVFRSNIPKYFCESEIDEFSSFLRSDEIQYLVVEQSGAVVACGGSYVRNGVGRLCWGMVEQSKHGSLIGTALLAKRLNTLFSRNVSVTEVGIDTSQHSAGFFERFGFKAQRRSIDGFSEGLDCVEMTLSRQDWLVEGLPLATTYFGGISSITD